MNDHGAKFKAHKYKLENAVDMSSHLEDVIKQYSKKNSFLVALLPRVSPASVQEPESNDVKEAKEEYTLQPPSTPSHSVKDNHSAVSLASTSSLPLGATANPSPTVIEQSAARPAKRKYVYKLKCSHCDFGAASDARIAAHIAAEHGKPFHCDLCDYQAHHKARLVTHKEKVHSAKTSYRCSLCNNVTNTREAFILHMATHGACAKQDRYICFVRRCNYTGHFHVFIKHLALSHPDIDKLSLDNFKSSKPYTQPELKYPCHLCDFYSYRRVNLRLHFQFKHSSIPVEKLVSESDAMLPKQSEVIVSDAEIGKECLKPESVVA